MANFNINILELTEAQFDIQNLHLDINSCDPVFEIHQLALLADNGLINSILSDYYYIVPYKNLYITPIDDATNYNMAYLEYNGQKILPNIAPVIIDIQALNNNDPIPNLTAVINTGGIPLSGNITLSFNIQIEDTDNELSPSKPFYVFVEDIGCTGSTDIITTSSYTDNNCLTQKDLIVNIYDNEDRRVQITSTQGGNIDEVINATKNYSLVLSGESIINSNTVNDTVTIIVTESSTTTQLDSDFISRSHTGNPC